MIRTWKNSAVYALLTCALGYFIIMIISNIIDWRFHVIDDWRFNIVGLWWGTRYYYLSLIVPWLGSSLLLTVLTRLNHGAKRSVMAVGLSIGAYYFIVIGIIIVFGVPSYFEIHGSSIFTTILFASIWPISGFIIGCFSGWIANKVENHLIARKQ